MRHWIPQQHGAWAMVIVPFLIGLLRALSAGATGWGHLTLGLFWLLGYFSFHAASGWLKSSARQKPKYLRPLIVYGGVSALLGLATLALAGLRILPWAGAFLPLVLPALWLAAKRKERATVGGLLTVIAAALMLPVARYLYPSSWADWPNILAETGLVFGYFFGTVLFVKTNIRERGSRAFLMASIGWHALLLAAAAAAGWLGLVSWGWTGIAAVVLLRAVVLPPMRLRPKTIGFLEIVVCVGIAVLALTG
ncbi:YwiC-like family protein [Tessaracoccus sp. OH4464_COT-324]|uniref:YwiC-like family protein n=1 Tax=Tessaracoccus sp. OH4464_COT-324 TaxID=2491059 RepID=UPI000F635621|nr:YwiC-like family protein [Tessaracoccus sp. OH4464_COT-324]RRD47727.1 hypothetical protein EII42_00265 [Tessaracoccus sp. OH4464_COT-324]